MDLPPDSSIPTWPAGRHAWLWRLAQVRDWKVFARARAHGFVGLHLHGGPAALGAVATRDLVLRARDAGIYLGASLGCDTGRLTKEPDPDRPGTTREVAFVGTPWEKIADAGLRVADLLGPGQSFCFDWEGRWERKARRDGHVVQPDRRADAAKLAAKLAANKPGYAWWDAPWWRPDAHPTAPTDEFGRAMAFRVPQTYFVYAKGGVDRLVGVPSDYAAKFPGLRAPEYMVRRAREEYATRAVQKPLAWGFQATAQAVADRLLGLCLRAHPTTVWWHFLRLFAPGNEPARRVFRAAALIDARFADAGATFAERARAAQAAVGVAVDGWVGPTTADALLKKFDRI